MDEAALLAEQYADASNLGTRGEFNDRFTVRDEHPHLWYREQISLGYDATILDLGCGPGSFWTANAGRIPEDWSPVLADLSPGMVSTARERLDTDTPTARLAAATAEALPFAAGTFDGVFAFQMLYHAPDRDRAIAECRRVLVEDGTCYASTGSEVNAAPLFELMSTVADGPVEALSRDFTAENGREQLAAHFETVETRTFENEVRVDDPDAVVAYALSLPLEDPALAPFEVEDAPALRELAAERIAAEGEIRWPKDMTLFVAHAG